MAEKLNIVIDQGATFPLYVEYKDPDGDPIDLTGYSVRMQIRQTPTATTKLLDFDSDDLDAGMTIGDLDETGVVDIAIAPSVTSGLAFNSAEWDLVIESPSGVVTRLVQGKASVSLGVTR